MAALAAELDRQGDKAMTADMFISMVRKYARTKKLTEQMLGELVQRIEMPDALTMPEVTMQTWKGVAVSYLPALPANM